MDKITVTCLVLALIVLLALISMKKREPAKCPKCSSENLDWYDSRCKELMCQEEDCDGSIRVW